MSIESVFKMVDAGLPAGLPGISDAAAGHPLTTSQVNVGGGAMPGMPTPQLGAQTNGLPDFLKMAGMRGKGG